MGAIKHNNVHSVEMLTAGKGGRLFKSALLWTGLRPPCAVCPLLSTDSSGGGSTPLGVDIQTQLYVNSPVSCSPKFLFSVKVKN